MWSKIAQKHVENTCPPPGPSSDLFLTYSNVFGASGLLGCVHTEYSNVLGALGLLGCLSLDFKSKSGRNQVKIGAKSGPSGGILEGFSWVGAGGVGPAGRGPVAPRKVSTLIHRLKGDFGCFFAGALQFQSAAILMGSQALTLPGNA